MTRNFRLTLCYDGTRWRGWQRQGNTDNTIQARVEGILSRLLDQPVEIAASGRTDAGVHARRQVCSFRADTNYDNQFMLTDLRKYLPEDIGALELTEAAPRFHARLNCREKTYVYRVWNSAEPNVFERKYLYAYPAPLDLDLMRRAGESLLGEHDFSAFCSAKHMKKSTVRELKSIGIERLGGEVRLTYTGNGFLYNMVRILTGTLLEVGSGQRSAESVCAALESFDRGQAGFTAPAQGLILWDVRY
ncbi:MAG: tRNA pseudouridine(38-40) synthase TruA [Oscillospiraceae bacterium]|nr:tRNA pseudouridine(38-40) synthase TruA [Oscillospiraceae bacterium]